MDSKIRSYLGLSKKAGGICSGEFQVLNAIRKKMAFLVIVTEDASKNTKKKFNDKCSYYSIPIIEYSTKEEISKILGQSERSVIAVVDINFYKAINTRFEEIMISE